MTARYRDTVAGRRREYELPPGTKPNDEKGIPFWEIVWPAVSAVSSLIIAGVAIYGAITVLRPQSHFMKVNVVAHSPGFDERVARSNNAWENMHLFEAPWEPETETYSIRDLLTCPRKYKPAVAWHEITGSWPTVDIMYTVNVEVEEDNEDIKLSLRTRNRYRERDPSKGGGYAYVDVIVRCQLRTAILPERDPPT